MESDRFAGLAKSRRKHHLAIDRRSVIINLGWPDDSKIYKATSVPYEFFVLIDRHCKVHRDDS